MFNVLILILVSALGVWPGDANSASGAVGTPVADFRLRDTAGQYRSLSEFKNKKAVVIVFIGTQCPIANSYTPTLIELHNRYAEKGVQFLAINANSQDSFEDVCKHARERKIPFPVLKDSEYKGTDALGAHRTPEAFLLDSSRVIRYRGHIDNQYGYTYRRFAPTRTELKDAIEELLANEPILIYQTEVQGCKIGR
jgi:peroxiredoxin